MKWLKRTGIALGVLILILAIVPFFISLNDYIPRIEQEASEQLNQPVKIESLRLALLPMPHLTVSGLTVGKNGDLTAGSIIARPEVWSLFAATKVIKSIEIDKLVLTQQALDMIQARTRPDAKGKSKGDGAPGPEAPPAVRVGKIKLDSALAKLGKVTFGPFDAQLRLTDEGGLEGASLTTQDGKLNVAVKPERDRYLIDAAATSWTLPAGPPVHFDELGVKGVATTKGANLEVVRAKLYGGSVAGNASLGWEKGLQLKGSLAVNQVEVRSLLKALGRPPTLSGRLNAKPVFSASVRDPERLVSALRLETPFEVQGGVLHGMDIGKAATSLISKEGAKGGETRFDRFSGHLALDRGTRRLTRLNIASGSLSADGNVTISPRDELSGRVNANVKAANLAAASVPLNVTGSLESPILYPTGGTIAGAAVGTAVLGPVGTGFGAKVGQWAEGLFGKK